MVDRVYPVDTKERKKAFNWAAHCLTMRIQNPGSKLWRMRVRQSLRKMEELWNVVL